MFLYRPFGTDSRVEREASALAAAGYDVEVIAFRKEGLGPSEERRGFRITRVDADPWPSRIARRVVERRRSRHGGDSRQGGDAPDAGTSPAAGGRRLRRILIRLGSPLLRLHLRRYWRNFQRRAVRLASERPADVWFAHDLETLPAGAAAKRELGGRLVYDSHELYTERMVLPPEPRRRRFWERTERELIGEADHVFAVSEPIAAELRRRYPGSDASVLLNVPEGGGAAAGDAAALGRAGLDLRKRLSIPPDQRIVLFLGGQTPNRGLEPLIAALAELPDCVAVLVGHERPGYRDRLKALARSRGAEERLHILDAVPPSDVVTLASSADVAAVLIQGASLSYRITLPNKLFESLAAGVPVIASDFEVYREIVGRHEVGALCDPDDPGEIARAITEVVGDPARLEELRANARRAASQYNWERESEKLLSVVGELAPRSPARPAQPSAR